MGSGKYNATEEAEKSARALADFVNPYGCDLHTFIHTVTHRTHRTLQQSIGKLIFKLLRMWADSYSTKMYDLRNEHTCRTSKRIVEYMDKEHPGWDSPPLV